MGRRCSPLLGLDFSPNPIRWAELGQLIPTGPSTWLRPASPPHLAGPRTGRGTAQGLPDRPLLAGSVEPPPWLSDWSSRGIWADSCHNGSPHPKDSTARAAGGPGRGQTSPPARPGPGGTDGPCGRRGLVGHPRRAPRPTSQTEPSKGVCGDRSGATGLAHQAPGGQSGQGHRRARGDQERGRTRPRDLAQVTTRGEPVLAGGTLGMLQGLPWPSPRRRLPWKSRR